MNVLRCMTGVFDAIGLANVRWEIFQLFADVTTQNYDTFLCAGEIRLGAPVLELMTQFFYAPNL